MTDKKKEPIVFLLPPSLEGREFAVAFDKHIDDIRASVILDMEELTPKLTNKLRMPDNPTSGIADVMRYQLDYRINLRRIGLFTANIPTDPPKRKTVYDPL